MNSPQIQNSHSPDISPNDGANSHDGSNLQSNLQTIRKLKQQLKSFRIRLPQRSMSSLLADEITLQGLAESTGTGNSHWLETEAEHWNDMTQSSSDWDDLNAIPLDDEVSVSSDEVTHDSTETGIESVDTGFDSTVFDSTDETFCEFSNLNGPVFSTSCSALDQWFPDQGIPAGSIIEIVSSTLGGGATHFCFALAKAICGDQGLLVVIDRRHDFHAAALVSLGFDLQNVLLVRPDNEEDHLWAMEQALGHPSVSAVWTRIETLDDRYQRRWQLAVEKSQAVGILQRPENVLSSPTWAFAQLQVSPNPFSSFLTANQAYYQTNPRFRSFCEVGFPFTENWILDVQAVRIRGMFQQPLLRLELHNQPGMPSQLASKPAADLPYLSVRPIHPNDPAVTKNFERFDRNLQEVASDEPTVSATLQETRFQYRTTVHHPQGNGAAEDHLRLDPRLADSASRRRTTSA